MKFKLSDIKVLLSLVALKADHVVCYFHLYIHVFRAHPFTTQTFHVFGFERPAFPAFILPRFSPLTGVFRANVRRLRESGTLQQLAMTWEGKMKSGGEGA